MTEPEPHPTARGVESAITEAAKKKSAADPSLNVSKRIELEHFDRFLSRVFSEGEDSEWVLKGGASILARVTSTRSTRDIDLYRRGLGTEQALVDLKRLASVDLGDHFRFEYAGHVPSIGTDAQPYVEGCRVSFAVFLGLAQKGSLQNDDRPRRKAVGPGEGSRRSRGLLDHAAHRRQCSAPRDRHRTSTAQDGALRTVRRPCAWGSGYVKLSRPVPQRAQHPTVDLAIELSEQLITPPPSPATPTAGRGRPTPCAGSDGHRARR